MGRKETKEYALYKQDELIAMGKISEIAKQTGLQPRTVRYYLLSSYQDRCKGGKAKILIPLNEEGEDA